MARRGLFILVILLAVGAVCATAAPNAFEGDRDYEAILVMHSPDDLAALKPYYLTITSRHDDELRLQVSLAEVATLQAAGWDVRILGKAGGEPEIGDSEYHTFAQIEAELAVLDVDPSYDAITELISFGESYNGHDLWVLKISDNAAVDEAEPVILYDLNVHGDEAIAGEVGMAFINLLLAGYVADDPQIVALVDDLEFYIVPVFNPDGHIAVSRYNGGGSDLNRDFPYLWEGWSTWSPEPETESLIRLARDIHPVAGIDFHSGAEAVNYNWDGVYTLSPDNDIELVASTRYGDLSGYWVTNGAQWYVADGTVEDWYHGAQGMLSAIVEISDTKKPSASLIDYYVGLNMDAMLDWASLARWGLWGTITDEATGDPIEATVFVDERMPVYSNPVDGSFFRILEAGTYDVQVFANGYDAVLFEDVVVPDEDYLTVAWELTASDAAAPAAVRCVINMRDDNNDNPANTSLPHAAFGLPDGVAFSTGVDGWAVWDMGSATPVSTDPGWRLRVTEIESDGADGYAVKVSDDWLGPWQSVGSGTGTAALSLSSVTLDEIRYVRLEDDGNGLNTGATPGADIDAIEAFYQVGDDDDDDDDDNDDNDDNDDDDNDDNDDDNDDNNDDDDNDDDNDDDDNDDDNNDDNDNDDDNDNNDDNDNDDDNDSGGCS
ncbi:MAG: M14 family zinc carboxypeptidase [Candidatus Lernaella stagnicola]|nr:M14 family zinc carboxypeptidase [Candidatus Lernaella stagnicola]